MSTITTLPPLAQIIRHVPLSETRSPTSYNKNSSFNFHYVYIRRSMTSYPYCRFFARRGVNLVNLRKFIQYERRDTLLEGPNSRSQSAGRDVSDVKIIGLIYRFINILRILLKTGIVIQMQMEKIF